MKMRCVRSGRSLCCVAGNEGDERGFFGRRALPFAQIGEGPARDGERGAPDGRRTSLPEATAEASRRRQKKKTQAWVAVSGLGGGATDREDDG